MSQPIMPFPGMDPYLEHSVLWEEVHAALIIEIRKQLVPQLLPRYVAKVEQRVFIEVPAHQRKPDVWIQRTRQFSDSDERTTAADEANLATPVVVEIAELEIKETYIEIRDRYQDMKVVTAIEVLSTWNKMDGKARDQYLEKQVATTASETHLVEIDLLRTGKHTLAIPEAEIPDQRPFAYLICVSRWPHRARFELYPFGLRERLPKFPVPLMEPDPDVSLDLQAAMEQIYADGGYMLYVRYENPCESPLDSADQTWANERWKKFQSERGDLFPTEHE